MSTPAPVRILTSRLLAAGSLLLFCATAGLHARELTAIYLPGTAGTIPKAHLIGASGVLEVELPQRNLSPTVKLPKGDLLLAALASPPPVGEKVPAGAPRVSIPASWERCILVFLGDEQNTVFPVKIIPVNASQMNFPKGNTLMFNLSNSSILAQFGKERIQLEAGKSGSFGAPIQGFGSYPVGIDCILRGESKHRAVCRSIWQHDPEVRQILFIIPQQDNAIPRVWGVVDRSEDEQGN